MKARINLALVVLLALFFVSCGGDLSNLKEIQRQNVDGFNVIILNHGGVINHGEGSFVVEFRDTESNKLKEVGSVLCSAVMHMGSTIDSGQISIDFTDIPGRYDVKYNLPMKGSWIYTLYFNGKYRIQYTLDLK
jgi:hypothetical protein